MQVSLGLFNREERMTPAPLRDELLELKRLQREIEHVRRAEACLAYASPPSIDEQAERTDQALRVGGREAEQRFDRVAAAHDLLNLRTDSLAQCLDLVGLGDRIRGV